MRRHAGRSAVPEIVHDTLRAPGRPLDQPQRAHFESRFHQDFSRVRVHADSGAAQSADAVHARAYTAGSHIVFGAGAHAPASRAGHRLLAHEMNHVVQQSGARVDASLAVERDPEIVAPLHRETASVMRADQDAVRQISKLSAVVGAGIHFFPENLVDTQIGPVEPRSVGSKRLNVIIGEGLSPRVLAREILPLWTTATPFTPPGGGPAVLPGVVTEEELAKALLVWNDTFLGLPSMTKWRVGLTFPLPMDVSDAGIGTVNTDQIRAMAGAFDATLIDLIDQRATASVALPAVLAAEEARLFLADHASAFSRGLAITVRATTNATASLALITEVFRQLSPVQGLEVALEAIENMSPTEMELLQHQTAGGSVLDVLDDALRRAPAPVPQQFQTRLTDAQARIDAHVVHILNDPPSSVPNRAEKTVTVDTLKVAGSNLNPSTQVQVASAIYAQCNVRIDHGVNRDAPATFLGADNILQSANSCSSPSREERTLFEAARRDFGFSARIQAYFVPTFRGITASAYSFPGDCSPGRFLGTTVLSNSSDNSTLAHEIGHILLNPGSHASRQTLMQPRPRPNELTDAQCARIYRNA